MMKEKSENLWISQKKCALKWATVPCAAAAVMKGEWWLQIARSQFLDHQQTVPGSGFRSKHTHPHRLLSASHNIFLSLLTFHPPGKCHCYTSNVCFVGKSMQSIPICFSTCIDAASVLWGLIYCTREKLKYSGGNSKCPLNISLLL